MEVSVAAKGDQLRMVIKGRLDESGVELMRRRMTGVDLTAYKGLCMDCRQLEYISSAGIGALMRLHWSFNRSGGQVRLEHVSPQILSLFRTLKLDRVMTIS